MLLRSESERSVLPFVTNQHLIVLSSYREGSEYFIC